LEWKKGGQTRYTKVTKREVRKQRSRKYSPKKRKKRVLSAAIDVKGQLGKTKSEEAEASSKPHVH